MWHFKHLWNLSTHTLVKSMEMEANSKFTAKVLTSTYFIYAQIRYISLPFNEMSDLYSITYMLFNTTED